jgi:Glycosyl hydrolases family 28
MMKVMYLINDKCLSIKMKRYIKFLCSAIAVFIFISSFKASAVKEFNIKDYGAIGDSVFLNTQAIQKAIDACTNAGGGVVVIPADAAKPSIYLSGTIILKKNVTLRVDKGAVLRGSTNMNDYTTIEPFIDGVNATRGACLIGAKDESSIGITGEGSINGQGQLWRKDNNKDYPTRPMLIRFVRVKKIVLKAIHLEGSAAWMCNFDMCENITVDDVNIYNQVRNANNDGIDIDACKNVSIKNSVINSSDDAICFKSTRGDNACENVRVENNDLQSNCAAIKFGTESMGDFKNFSIKNNYIHDTRLAGIKIISADGAINSNIKVSNTTMKNVVCPLLIILESRLKTYHDYPKKQTGAIKNILIDGVKSTDTKLMGIMVTGVPGQYVGEGIRLQNIDIAGLGGNDNFADTAIAVKEIINTYPEFTNFGKMAASAIFIRHVKGIEFTNINIVLSKSDVRYPFILDDVRDGETIKTKLKNISVNNSKLMPAQIKLVNVTNVDLLK